MSATLGIASRVWKYPRMPYWPYSPAQPREGDSVADAKRFVGVAVVVTEKLDGSNTLLYQGDVYARSVSAPAAAKWLGMVRKHHAWKVTEPDVFLYGEEIYGVHSIEYDPVPEDETFYAFALRYPKFIRLRGARSEFGEICCDCSACTAFPALKSPQSVKVVPYSFGGALPRLRYSPYLLLIPCSSAAPKPAQPPTANATSPIA